jgi:hypothetical protein
VAQVDAAQAVVVEEPSVLPAGADANTGGKPTAIADADVDEDGWWGEEHTPPVLWGSTTERGSHILPLITFLVSMNLVIRNDGIAHKF